jgi:hypothetical protein
MRTSATDYFLAAERLPGWFSYPTAFRRLVAQGLVDLTPWHVLPVQAVEDRIPGLARRYPGRALVPFAARHDNDDVACWEPGRGDGVLVVHDFASPGWEDEEAFTDLRAWLRMAVEETIDWE